MRESLVLVNATAHRGIALWIEIDEQHAPPDSAETRCEIHPGGGLAYPAFLIGDRECATTLSLASGGVPVWPRAENRWRCASRSGTPSGGTYGTRFRRNLCDLIARINSLHGGELPSGASRCLASDDEHPPGGETARNHDSEQDCRARHSSTRRGRLRHSASRARSPPGCRNAPFFSWSRRSASRAGPVARSPAESPANRRPSRTVEQALPVILQIAQYGEANRVGDGSPFPLRRGSRSGYRPCSTLPAVQGRRNSFAELRGRERERKPATPRRPARVMRSSCALHCFPVSATPALEMHQQ